MTVNYDNTVRPCPQFKEAYKTDSTCVETTFNEPRVNSVRDHYATNQQPLAACQECVVADKLGASARRHLYSSMKGLETLPQWVDIRLSNACNLKCRTCSSDYSSRWIPDTKALSGKGFSLGGERRFNSNYELLHSALRTPAVRIVELKGGEPLLSLMGFLEKYDALEDVDKELKITTNGTVLQPKVMSFLSRFAKVTFLVSVDAARDRYRPLRGCIAQDVEPFLRAVERLPNASSSIQTVVSVLNLLELPYILRWLDEFRLRHGVHKVGPPDFLNILQKPVYLSPFVLSEKVLAMVIERLRFWSEQADVYQPLDPLIRVLESHRSASSDENQKLFQEFVRSLDRLRGEDLISVLDEDFGVGFG